MFDREKHQTGDLAWPLSNLLAGKPSFGINWCSDGTHIVLSLTPSIVGYFSGTCSTAGRRHKQLTNLNLRQLAQWLCLLLPNPSLLIIFSYSFIQSNFTLLIFLKREICILALEKSNQFPFSPGMDHWHFETSFVSIPHPFSEPCFTIFTGPQNISLFPASFWHHFVAISCSLMFPISNCSDSHLCFLSHLSLCYCFLFGRLTTKGTASSFIVLLWLTPEVTGSFLPT